MRTSFPGACFVCALLAATACTPRSICWDTVENLDAMWARCGYPIRVALMKEDGTPATCEDVNQVTNPDQYQNQCIPWAQTVTCEELAVDPYALPAFCDFRNFMYFE